MTVSLKKISSHLAISLSEMMLYFPKGLFLGSADFFDNLHSKIKCKNLACIYCDRHLQLRKKAYLKKKGNAFFNVLGKVLRCFFILALSPMHLLMAILPNAAQKYCLNKLKACAIKMRQFINWAQPYRTQASYYFFLPCLLLALCAHVWGLAILPEIYIFLAASSWSGVILNFAANLIVRGQDSEEWQFAKNWWTVVFNPENDADKNLRWHLFQKSIRLAVELTLIGGLGRLAQFITYGTTAFFSWLVAYVIYKAGAEEGQHMLFGLEKKMKARKDASVPLNTTWLVTYHLYKGSCSTKAYENYHTWHVNKHKYPLRYPRRKA